MMNNMTCWNVPDKPSQTQGSVRDGGPEEKSRKSATKPDDGMDTTGAETINLAVTLGKTLVNRIDLD